MTKAFNGWKSGDGDSGVYFIVNQTNDGIYVGASSGTKRRWRQHRYMLKHGVHHNANLQNAFLAGDKLSFALIETTDALNERERHWLRFAQSIPGELCYNPWPDITPVGAPRSKEHAQKIGNALRGRKIANIEKHREAVKKLRKPIIGTDANGNERFYESGTEVSKQYNIPSSTLWYALNNGCPTRGHHWRYANA